MEDSNAVVVLQAFDLRQISDVIYALTYARVNGIVLCASSQVEIPSIKTSPRYGSRPVESRMLTSTNRIFESGWVPKMSYCLGCRLSSNSISSIYLMFLGKPLKVLGSLSVSNGHETGGSSILAGAIFCSTRSVARSRDCRNVYWFESGLKGGGVASELQYNLGLVPQYRNLAWPRPDGGVNASDQTIDCAGSPMRLVGS